MARKKLSEMTPVERVDRALRGASWEEAEEAGIEILARCISLHYHARGEGKEYFTRLYQRIGERVVEWSKTHASILAMAKLGFEMEQEEKKSHDQRPDA